MRGFIRQIGGLTLMLVLLGACAAPGPGATAKEFYWDMSRGQMKEALQLTDLSDEEVAEKLKTMEANKDGNPHRLLSVTVVKEEVQGDVAHVEVILHSEGASDEHDHVDLRKINGRWKIVVDTAAKKPGSAMLEGPAGQALAQLLPGGFRPGDIIFRRGPGPVSQLVLAGEAGGEFSHVGLVVVRGNEVFVVHASPAQTAGEQATTRIEPLASFVQASRASRVAVYRLDPAQIDQSEGHARQAAAVSEDMAKRHVPFDFRFEMSSADSVYCTELVMRAYARAGVDLKVKPSGLRMPFLRERVVFPSNLLESPVLQPVRAWRTDAG
jgi:hypothetical protein